MTINYLASAYVSAFFEVWAKYLLAFALLALIKFAWKRSRARDKPPSIDADEAE